MKIRLSVILTTHLRPDLLRRSISSIAELGPEVQIVLCSDEGSVATRTVAAECLRENDLFASIPGVKGPSATRNLGLSLAQGEYISFLDDDDTLDPNVASLLSRFDGKHVLYTNYRKIFEERSGNELNEIRRVEKKTSKKSISFLKVKNFLHLGCFFAPRDAIRGLAFRPDLTSSEDWEFLLQLLASTPFQHFDIFGSNWHITEDEASRDKVTRSIRAQNYRKIYKQHPVQEETVLKLRLDRLRELGEKGSDVVL